MKRIAEITLVFLVGCSVGCNQTTAPSIPSDPPRPHGPVNWPRSLRTKLDLVQPPEINTASYLDQRYPRDMIAAAAHLAKSQPAAAARTYLQVVALHGDRYEPAFSRNASRNAFLFAWEDGDPALIRGVLSAYDDRFTLLNRVPEPEFIADIRRFFVEKDDNRLQEAYQALERKLPPLPHPILESDRSRSMKTHENAVLALVKTYRDMPAESWGEGILDALVEAEAALLCGNVHPSSQILLFAEAERSARKKGSRTDETALTIAVAKLFLTRTGLVREDKKQDYVGGQVYKPQ